MAFSMVAIVILLVAGASVAVYGSSAVWSEKSAMDLASREKACQEAFSTVRETAYIVAWAQFNSSGLDMDNARLSFLLAMNETIRSISPYRSGAAMVTLDASEVDIGILSMPESDSADSVDHPAFFFITGQIKVNVSDENGKLEQKQVIREKLYIPVPLLAYLSTKMSEVIEGGASPLWNCVRYELSSLVQLRSLQDPAIAHDMTKTKMVLTDADVKNAVLLATIILQRSVLHKYDDALLDGFTDVPGCSISPSAIKPYLEREGSIDPADLFLILYGFDDFPVHDALAQALYASADMLALRYLDYLQVIDLIDLLEETVQTGVLLANDVILWVLGKDLAATQALDWVRGKMAETGHSEDTYRYLWSEPIDWVINMTPSQVYLRNSSGGYILLNAGGNFSVDVPETDIFMSSFWKNAYVDYTKGTDEASDALISYFKDLALAIADRSERIFIDPELDPFDEISPMDDLKRQLSQALDENRGWFAEAQGDVEVQPRPDPLGQAMAKALSLNEASLYGEEGLLREAFCSVTERMYAQLVEGNPELREAPHEENIRLLREAAQDPSWGLWPLLTSQYNEDTSSVTNELTASFMQPEDANFIYKFLVEFSSGFVVNTPSLESWIEGQLIEMMEDVMSSQSMLGLETRVSLPTFGGLILVDGLGLMMDVSLGLQTVISFADVAVIDPVTSPGSVPSIHITDLCNASHSPFQTGWDVQTTGSISVKITVQSESALFPKMSRTSSMPLDTNLRICAVTGWPMAGVEYRPDHTLSGDALAVLQKLWSWLSDALGQIGRGAYQIFTWIMQVKDLGNNLCNAMIDQLVSTTATMIEVQRKISEWLLVDGIGMLIEACTGGAQTKLFDVDFLGARMCVELNQGDLALASAKNIVKVTLGFALGSCKFSVSGRLIKLNGDYQCLVNGTITDTTTRLNLIVDPFMTAYSHLIEVSGWIDSISVKLHIPEVARYTTYSFGATDIPGLKEGLENIPSPIPGTKLKANFGIQFKFATDAPPYPVINEFESNPTGADAGREWVEIFNPSGQAVTLSGWSLQTTHGKVRIDELGDVLLLPYSRVIFTLPDQALDNGDTKTFPWTDGIALVDPEGKRVDVAPTVMDKRNDGRTWQRADDASDRWVFRSSTKGMPNSHVMYGPIDELNLVNEVLRFYSDVLNCLESSGWSLDSLAYAIQSSLWSLMERFYDGWGPSLVEAAIFLDMAIASKDNSECLSAGVSYSLKVDSEFIRQCWDWVCRTIAKLLIDPLNSHRVIASSMPVRELLEHSYYAVQVYIKISKPEKAAQTLFWTAMDLTDTNFKFFSNVKVNLVAAGVFLGKEMGKMSIQVGVGCTISSLHHKGYVGNFIGDRQTEVWLFKLRLEEA